MAEMGIPNVIGAKGRENQEIVDESLGLYSITSLKKCRVNKIYLGVVNVHCAAKDLSFLLTEYSC